MKPDDRLALTDLVHRYAAWVDDRRFDDVVGLFADDATLSLPDVPRSLEPTITHQGHDDIASAINAVAAVTRTQHAIVGEVYDAGADEDVARGRISAIAHHWTRRDEEITDFAWHLRYADEYVRTDDGWRFRSRTVTIDAIETPPVRRLRPDGT
jgi:3-phenylpropionate/cinnamic acid dioxygenase small subunit